ALGGEIDLDDGTSYLETLMQVFVPISQEKTVILLQASTMTGHFANFTDGEVRQTQKGNPFWTQYTVHYKGAAGGVKYVELGIVSQYRFMDSLSGLNHNQGEVAKLLDGIRDVGSMTSLLLPLSEMVLSETYSGATDYSQTKALLTTLSGAFLANVLTVGAMTNDSGALYSRVRLEEVEQEKISVLQSIWLQGNLSGFSIDANNGHIGDFSGTMGGIQAGFPLWRGRNSVGVFLNYDYKNLKEASDKADVDDIRLGAYMGYFFDDNINIKGNISAGIQNFKTERNVAFYNVATRANSDFNTYSLGLGVQGEYVMPMDEETDFKPFIELQSGFVFNGDIEESGADAVNLKINGGSYVRVNTNIGIMLEDSTGTFNWHVRGYLGFVLAGSRPEYQISFAYMPNYEMDIWGTNIPDFYLGAGAWIEQRIGESLSIFANGDVNAGDGAWNYAISLGVSYRVGGNYNQLKTSEDIMRSGEYKNKVSLVGRDNYAAPKSKSLPYKTTDKNVVVGAETQVFNQNTQESIEVIEIDRQPSDIYNNDVRIEVEEQNFENKVKSGDEITSEERAAHQRRLAQLQVLARRDAQIQAQKQVEKEAAAQAAEAQGQAEIISDSAVSTSVDEKSRRALAKSIKESDDAIVVLRSPQGSIAEVDADMDLYEIISTDEEDDIVIQSPRYSSSRNQDYADEAVESRNRRAAVSEIKVIDRDNIVSYEEKGIKTVICVFDKGSYALSNSKKIDIKNIASQIKRYNYTKVSVIINKGSRTIDKVLNENRARVIYEELYKNGIDIRKLDYINEASDTKNGDRGVIIIDYIAQ
ncbi:MAG: autotransporter domain-containing protein, partial [Endomicrobium sp.]|nr:autotransporter domain-containing protein [Endomicrobium sp.]